MSAQPEFQQRLPSIELLWGENVRLPIPGLARKVRELVRLIMDLHGAGIDRGMLN